MECILCNKEYVRKAETSFNMRLSNHQKDVKKLKAIMACRHFLQESLNFKTMYHFGSDKEHFQI